MFRIPALRRGAALTLGGGSGGTEAPLLVEKWNVPANEEQLRDSRATILVASLVS